MTTVKRGRPPVKARRIEQQLRQRIAAGEWQPGALMPTEAELCRVYGASRMCLRSAMDPLVEAGLLVRQRGRGTFLADGDRPRQVRGSVAVLLHELQFAEEQSYHDQIHRGLRRFLEHGQLTAAFHRLRAKQTVADFMDEHPDLAAGWGGVLSLPAALGKASLAALERAGIPAVAMAWTPRAISHVDIDNRDGGALAMRHLLETGRRRVLVLDNPKGSRYAADRAKGIRAVVAEAGLDDGALRLVANHRMHGHQAQDHAAELVAPLLNEIDAIIVYMEHPTIGVYRAIEQQGLRVGIDIAVVHYNDFPWLCDVLRPQPTAVRQPFEAVARQAAELLVERMRDPSQPTAERKVRPELIRRGSS